MEAFNSSRNGMLARMRAPRLSCQQFDVLIEFMAAHPNFAAGRAGGVPGLTTREEHEMLWHKLTTKLNAASGPTKSRHKWQKCWVDLKSNARGRIAKIRAAMLNPALERSTPALTQWDHRVLSIMGPGYADILSLYKDCFPGKTSTPKRTAERLSGSVSRGAASMDVNSNSSLDDHDQAILHQLDNSQHSSLVSEHSEHDSRSPNMTLSDVKREAIETEEIIYEEDAHDAECDVEEVEFVADLVDGYDPTENGDDRPGKRKISDGREDEQGHEKFPKGTINVLERLANAAEESNAIQRDIAEALNRLSDNFAQVIPLLTHLATNVPIQRN